MPSDAVLIPEDEKAIEFYGDELVAALVRIEDEARVFVPLRPLCDFLGISWSAQFERIQRDEVLSDEVRFVRVTRTNSAGGDPDVLCLPLEFLPGWLFGISARRVKKELYERILLYRRACYRSLWDAFKFQILPGGAGTIAPASASGPSWRTSLPQPSSTWRDNRWSWRAASARAWTRWRCGPKRSSAAWERLNCISILRSS